MLCLLLSGAVVVASALVSTAQPQHLVPRRALALSLAAPDSDSTAIGDVEFDSVAPPDEVAPSSITLPESPAAPDTAGVPDSVATADTTLLPQAIADSLSEQDLSTPLDSTDLAAAAEDSLLVDSTQVQRSLQYFPPGRRRDWITARPFQRELRPFSPALGSYWRHELEMDSTGRYYIARETVNSEDVRAPLHMDYETYRQYRLQRDLRDNWRTLSNQRSARQLGSNNPFGFSIVIPGGRESAFSTIFGKNEVDLRVNGRADINAGFDYRKSEQQAAFTGQASQVDPTFKQDLQLGIRGTIGDKLNVDVSWDTQSQFDYQNQLRLQYTGYEDEIIQRIEAGNVMLQTPSTLIRGGQSLFGIKSELQLGGVRLTTVASQQEGEANNLSIDGGSQTVEFELRPTDYDNNTHFFLGYYFRNRWNEALSQPPNLLVANGFDRITDIEVWRLTNTTAEDENIRQAVAMVDLGERPAILELADQYLDEEVPTEQIDQYTNLEMDQQLRNNQTPRDFLEGQKGLSSADYQVGRFKRLERGRDYDFDPVLGYISLKSSLQESEALAVSYRVVANGQLLRVGDLSTETGGTTGGQSDQKMVLKLLRPVNLKQPALDSGFNPAAWYLELKNIYRLRAGIQPTDFDLQVLYEPPGKTPSKTVPEIGGRSTLLELLGLDRLNVDGAPQPDDKFDYIRGFTINTENGLLIFPFLEPFGNRIRSLVQQNGGNMGEAETLYIFDRLYTEKKENARRDTQKDVYRIRGSYKGAVQSVYDLGAWAGLVEGSVRVTSGGRPLQEGTDYVVDYQGGGTVTVINNFYLTSGRDINISFEQNQFINLQKKTLLGMRADYGDLQDPVKLGATMMRLSQKSPIDKFRLGEEPISNLIWGVDGKIELQPRWLTRAVDFLPLVQTREPSAISITGEFAQLRPSHVQTNAFQKSRRELREVGRDFTGDELRGLSYIDDFEGFENTFSLKQPGSWVLSSAPDSIGAIDPLPGDPDLHSGIRYDSLRTNYRASLGWYTLNQQLFRELDQLLYGVNPASIEPVLIEDVYPNRDVRGQTDRTLPTMDLHFSPRERGPYNYTTDLPGFFSNPKFNWGGMTQRIPDGYNDFTLKNIEFVEFVFRVFPENEQEDAGPDAKLYVDLGYISEDVIPNQRLNTEDGLSTTSASASDLDHWSREARGTQNQAIDINRETRQTEDLGLDGLASHNGGYGEFATEFNHFQDFLNSLDENAINDPLYAAEVAKARIDPSGDDYRYFNSGYFRRAELYPGGAKVQQLFSRFFPGTELNSYEAQTEFGDGDSRGNARYPDSEDLNGNSTVDTDNSYFQYELPLSRAELDRLAQQPGVGVGDYVVTEIQGKDGSTQGWYQIRIPVRDFTRRVGDIQGFDLIESMRIWTTGHEVPITMRFAALELVGSQWQKSTRVDEDTTGGAVYSQLPTLSISSINNEENVNEYNVPFGTIVNEIRLPNGRTQDSREQSMVLRVQDLGPGEQRAIFKTFQGMDLLKYEHVRMFVHMHGQTGEGIDLTTLEREIARGRVQLFIRIGANETNDYYEYVQPLTPSAPGSSADQLWQTRVDYNGQLLDLNSVNIRLSSLNQLKFARDTQVFPVDEVFWNVVQGTDGPIRQGPDISGFTPPGTRIGIKGNPSLAKVNTIVIGIRNASDPELGASLDRVLGDVSVWVNELRVAGYDETNGWAGVMNADIKLADLARVRANITQQTDGFGSLSSTLGQREQTNIQNWGFTSELFLDKFLPERFGWALPVNVQYQSNTSTPRFSPQRGDVRVDEIVAQIEEREDLSPAEKERQKTEAVEAAQTASVNRSITTRIAKTGSRSKFLRNTLDALSLSYSYADVDASTPQLRLNDSWRWAASANYAFRMQPKTVRPLWFLEDVPVLGFLGDINFNYAPSNITLAGTANRNFSASQERLRLQPGEVLEVPEIVEFPLRQGHTFAHRRQFDLGYNPFTFLNLTFTTSTNQSLNAVGVDTLSSLMVLTDSISNRYTTYPNLDIEAALQQGIIDSSMIERTAFELSRLQVTPTDRVLSRIFSGNTPRTEQYQQTFRANFQPKFTRYTWMNWLTISPISYSATFGWTNGPVGRVTGANVSSRVELRGGVTLRPQEFWRKFDFYTALEDAQRKAETDRRQRMQRRDSEREQRKEARAREREREREIRRLEAIAEADTSLADSVATVIESLPPLRVPQTAAAPADTTVADSTQGGGFRIPIPDPVPVLRRIALALTGIRDLSVNYDNTRNSSSSNVGDMSGNTYYSLYDALRGLGPSIGYRFGFQDRIAADDRVLLQNLQVTDAITNNHRLQGRTMLSPSQKLQISLNWNTDWGTTENLTFNNLGTDLDGLPIIDQTLTQGGNTSSSIWAFGASYLDVFKKQRSRYDADESAASDPMNFGDANGDGVALSNATVKEDFISSFVRGPGTLDSRGLVPFPLPSWNVTYSGFGDWPIIRRLVQSASLKHGYSGRYSTDYRTNIATGDQLQYDLAGRRITYAAPAYDVGAIRVSEQYTPLIGVDLSWKGGVQTNVGWNKNNTYSMSTSNFELGHQNTNQFDLTASYSRQGMRIPFFGRVQNRVSFNLTVAYAQTSDVRYPLKTALRDYLNRRDTGWSDSEVLRGDNVSTLTETSRYTVTPRISYSFSQKLQADFSLTYQRFIGDSRQPSFSSVTGGFNVRVSITN